MYVLQIGEQIVKGFHDAPWYEYLAVIAGIASVWFSKKENVLVYPVGLVNTTIYTFWSFKIQLIGESAVNLYYTVMSIYGWVLWLKKDKQHHYVLHISFSGKKEWLQQIGFFAFMYAILFSCLLYLKHAFYPGAIPWADGFAAATAFTGMWLMARKKVESWWWWIATNLSSVPLYFVKGAVVTSFYYFVLLILAIAGLQEWRKRATHHHANS